MRRAPRVHLLKVRPAQHVQRRPARPLERVDRLADRCERLVRQLHTQLIEAVGPRRLEDLRAKRRAGRAAEPRRHREELRMRAPRQVLEQPLNDPVRRRARAQPGGAQGGGARWRVREIGLHRDEARARALRARIAQHARLGVLHARVRVDLKHGGGSERQPKRARVHAGAEQHDLLALGRPAHDDAREPVVEHARAHGHDLHAVRAQPALLVRDACARREKRINEHVRVRVVAERLGRVRALPRAAVCCQQRGLLHRRQLRRPGEGRERAP
mmetsp:Transcript_16038/g.49970  ORF Transcript_16038/g.49970 Transcript_16038/m.49970 type:complete len:272 (+) Transcript_16038:287-1102(+)